MLHALAEGRLTPSEMSELMDRRMEAKKPALRLAMGEPGAQRRAAD